MAGTVSRLPDSGPEGPAVVEVPVNEARFSAVVNVPRPEDAVNAQEFSGFPPGTLKPVREECEGKKRVDGTWDVKVVFLYRADGWPEEPRA